MNKCLHLGLLLATDVLFVVGLPSVRIWPNNTKTIELGSVQKYYCKVEGVHNFFLTTSPRFFQAKGARRYIQNSTEIEKDTALLTKTFELFDEDTELFCVWKPVKTKSRVFPSTLLSERVAIRFSEPVMEESCTCDTWWPWLIAVALVGVVIVIIVVGVVIAFCRRTKAQREQQPLPNIQQEPSYSYATAPVMDWEEARARSANNRHLSRYQSVAPHLPPRNAEQPVYEYISPSGLKK